MSFKSFNITLITYHIVKCIENFFKRTLCMVIHIFLFILKRLNYYNHLVLNKVHVLETKFDKSKTQSTTNNFLLNMWSIILHYIFIDFMSHLQTWEERMLPLMEKHLRRRMWKKFIKTFNRQSQVKDTAAQLI